MSITTIAFATTASNWPVSADSNPPPKRNMISRASTASKPTITIRPATAAASLPIVKAKRDTGLEKMLTAAPDSRS